MIPKKMVSSTAAVVAIALVSSVRIAMPGSPPPASASARRRAYSELASANPEDCARAHGGAGGIWRPPTWRKGPGSWSRRLPKTVAGVREGGGSSSVAGRWGEIALCNMSAK